MEELKFKHTHAWSGSTGEIEQVLKDAGVKDHGGISHFSGQGVRCVASADVKVVLLNPSDATKAKSALKAKLGFEAVN